MNYNKGDKVSAIFLPLPYIFSCRSRSEIKWPIRQALTLNDNLGQIS